MALLSDDMRTLAQNLLQAHESRVEAVAALATDTAEQRQKLGEQRSGLATDTAAFINTMHAETRQKLDEYMLSLRGEVTATREKYQTDQAEAAKIWANLSQLKQKNRMTLDVAPRVKKGSATSSQAAENAWKMVSPAEPSVPVDDFKVIHGIGPGPAEPSDAVDELTVIHGIGPTLARHLSDAGITSFRQLAASNPEQLHLILGKSGKLAKVETWITQAQDLIR